MFKSTEKSKNNIGEDFEIHTVIAEGVSIEGDLLGQDSIRIDGKVIGNIKIDKGLVIGDTGEVDGNIECDSLITFGKIKGSINCKTIKLRSSGSIIGDIEAQQLSIDLGGELNGAVKMNLEIIQ